MHPPRPVLHHQSAADPRAHLPRRRRLWRAVARGAPQLAVVQSAHLLSFNGISGKSVACLLLYWMGRPDFAVDANVLRIMVRLGWLKHLRIFAHEAIAPWSGGRSQGAARCCSTARPPRRARRSARRAAAPRGARDPRRHRRWRRRPHLRIETLVPKAKAPRPPPPSAPLAAPPPPAALPAPTERVRDPSRYSATRAWPSLRRSPCRRGSACLPPTRWRRRRRWRRGRRRRSCRPWRGPSAILDTLPAKAAAAPAAAPSADAMEVDDDEAPLGDRERPRHRSPAAVLS